MTRTLPALATALALLVAAPPHAAAQAGGLSIELNKLEPQGSACRVYLVFNNSTGVDFESLTIALYLFDTEGAISKYLAVNVPPLPTGKTRVRLFDVPDLSCAGIGNILLNDVVECVDGNGAREDCVELVEPSSRNETRFYK